MKYRTFYHGENPWRRGRGRGEDNAKRKEGGDRVRRAADPLCTNFARGQTLGEERKQVKKGKGTEAHTLNFTLTSGGERRRIAKKGTSSRSPSVFLIPPPREKRKGRGGRSSEKREDSVVEILPGFFFSPSRTAKGKERRGRRDHGKEEGGEGKRRDVIRSKWLVSFV